MTLSASVDPAWVDGCACHGEPAYWNTDPRYRLGGYWRCAVTWRERNAAQYAALDYIAYQRRLLRIRRTKALARMAARAKEREA